MLRLLLRLFIFAVVISLSLYIGVQWKLKQDLEEIDKQLGPSIKFDFASSAMTLTGQVIVGGVEIRLSNPKINISVNKVRLNTGSIFSMAFLSSQFEEKAVPENFSLILDEVVIPLTPELVKLLSAIEQPDSWSTMSAVGCGKVKNLGLSQYFAMGYDYLVFSSETRYGKDSYSGNLVGTSQWSIEETSDFKVDFNIAGFFESLDKQAVRPVTPSIESMNIEVSDRGYNRHRNEYCGLKSEQRPEVYLGNHVKAVKQKFEQAGIKITPTGIRFYTEYLQPNSRLNINIKPQPSFSMADFGFYDESEIRGILGLDLILNGKNVGVLFNGWSHDKYSQIMFIDPSVDDEGEQNKRFETVIVKRSFKSVDVAQLPQNIGEQARITQTDGQEHIGQIIKVEDQRVYIATPRDGGTIERSVPINQVSRLEILTRNQ